MNNRPIVILLYDPATETYALKNVGNGIAFMVQFHPENPKMLDFPLGISKVPLPYLPPNEQIRFITKRPLHLKGTVIYMDYLAYEDDAGEPQRATYRGYIEANPAAYEGALLEQSLEENIGQLAGQVADVATAVRRLAAKVPSSEGQRYMNLILDRRLGQVAENLEGIDREVFRVKHAISLISHRLYIFGRFSSWYIYLSDNLARGMRRLLGLHSPSRIYAPSVSYQEEERQTGLRRIRGKLRLKWNWELLKHKGAMFLEALREGLRGLPF